MPPLALTEEAGDDTGSHVEVSVGGETDRMLVDTGSPLNECTTAFAAALGGSLQFDFGDGMTAACSPKLDRPAIEPESARESPGVYTATLGMKGLLQFDAFGWESNPLKLHFTPKTADSGANGES